MEVRVFGVGVDNHSEHTAEVKNNGMLGIGCGGNVREGWVKSCLPVGVMMC